MPRLCQNLAEGALHFCRLPLFCIGEGTQRTLILELVIVFHDLNVRGTFPRAGRVFEYCATDISSRREYGIALSSHRMGCQSTFAREKEAIILHSFDNRDVPHAQVRKSGEDKTFPQKSIQCEVLWEKKQRSLKVRTLERIR